MVIWILNAIETCETHCARFRVATLTPVPRRELAELDRPNRPEMGLSRNSASRARWGMPYRTTTAVSRGVETDLGRSGAYRRVNGGSWEGMRSATGCGRAKNRPYCARTIFWAAAWATAHVASIFASRVATPGALDGGKHRRSVVS